jgi:hypothetical protein
MIVNDDDHAFASDEGVLPHHSPHVNVKKDLLAQRRKMS